MHTFSEAQAGAAFSRIAKARLRNRSIKPADLCVYAWLAAEAARENIIPIKLTVSSMHHGFDIRGDGKEEEVCPVGLSLNTIKTSLARLEEQGFLHIERTPSTRGELLTLDLL
jgi:hypothetical protein